MPVTNFFWDGDNLLQEYDDAGATTAQYSTEPGQFGNVTSQRRSGQSHYYHHDPLGSTTELTNPSGDVTDTRRYKAFGETVEQSGSTTFPFQYVGHKGYYFDAERGTHYVRRRDLDALRGRWLSNEPLRQRIREAYAYAHNSPLSAIDPSGLATLTWISPQLGDATFILAFAALYDEEPTDSRALKEFKGCSPNEKAAIEKAFTRVCKELFKKCKKDTGLETCLDDLCSAEEGKEWEIECKKCDSPDTGGYTVIHDLACVGTRSKCKPHRFRNKNIHFCRGPKDEIPFAGFELEEIWIHEMLHNCCLDHEDNSPQWEKDIFASCVKKCLKEEDDGKCKCDPC
jgi:RHS repeat-associated protein